MKKILITAVIALSSLTTLSACANNNGTASNTTHHNNMQHHDQYTNSGHMGMRGAMNNMLVQLNLTAEQKAQMQALRQSAIKQDSRSTRMQNHQAMLAILTAEQRQKLAQMQSQHMNNGSSMNSSHMNNDGHMMNRGQHMNQNSTMNQ